MVKRKKNRKEERSGGKGNERRGNEGRLKGVAEDKRRERAREVGGCQRS